MIRNIALYFLFSSIQSTIIKKNKDNNSYNSYTLKNGIHVLECTNSNFNYSTFEISVEVGAKDGEIVGLCHLLEHCLLCESTEYTGKNVFDEFVSRNGGYYNAVTGRDSTTYVFKIISSEFKNALKYFSIFFCRPLFTAENIKSEISAIENEFISYSNNDDYKICRIGNMFKSKEYSHFGCGNRMTLKNVQPEDIQKLWKKYLSSKKKIYICHDVDISQYIADCFGHFPENSKKDDIQDNENIIFENFVPHVFDIKYTNRLICVKSVEYSNYLRISIELPKESKIYNKNYYNYLSHILTKKDTGSLLDQLMLQEVAWNLEINFDNNKFYTILILKIYLTKIGLTNKIKSICCVLNYFKNLKFSENEYYELKEFKKNKFQNLDLYKNELDQQSITKNMFLYPIEHIFYHDYIYEEYKKEELCLLLAIILKHENWLILFISNNFDMKDDIFVTEEYMQIKYNIDYKANLDNELLQMEEIFLINNESQNNCINQNNASCSNNINVPENPKIFEKIDNSICDYSIIYILLNMKFTNDNIIQIYVYFTLAEIVFKKTHATFMFKDSINLHLEFNDKGIELFWKGKNDKLFGYIEKFFQTIKKVDLKHLYIAKESVKYSLKKQSTETRQSQFKNEFKKIIYKNFIDVTNYVDELKNIKFDNLNLKHEYFLEILSLSAIKMETLIQFRFNLQALFNKPEKYRPEANFIIENYKINLKNNKNNGIFVAYKCGLITDYKDIASIRILEPWIKNEFYNKIRVEKELSYNLGAFLAQFGNMFFLIFFIESQTDCSNLEMEFLEFYKELKEKIKEISENDFNAFKDAAKTKYFSDPRNDKEKFDLLYESYFQYDSDYTKIEESSNAIKNAKREELKLPDEKIMIHAKKKND